MPISTEKVLLELQLHARDPQEGAAYCAWTRHIQMVHKTTVYSQLRLLPV